MTSWLWTCTYAPWQRGRKILSQLLFWFYTSLNLECALNPKRDEADAWKWGKVGVNGWNCWFLSTHQSDGAVWLYVPNVTCWKAKSSQRCSVHCNWRSPTCYVPVACLWPSPETWMRDKDCSDFKCFTYKHRENVFGETFLKPSIFLSFWGQTTGRLRHRLKAHRYQVNGSQRLFSAWCELYLVFPLSN